MTVQETKDYLKQIRNINDDINDRRKEKNAIRLLAESTGISYDKCGSPGGGNISDKVGNGAIKLVDLEKEIDEEISELIDIKVSVRRALRKVPKYNQRKVLYLSYIKGMDLEHIASKMNYSYKQICRFHGEGLIAIKDVLECH